MDALKSIRNKESFTSKAFFQTVLKKERVWCYSRNPDYHEKEERPKDMK